MSEIDANDDFLGLLNSLDDTPVVKEDYVRSAFPYPGGKSQSLEKILPHLPYKKTYCEPFGGAGSILLARHESPLEIFNDRYSGVVAFYRCIKDRTKIAQFLEKLEHILHMREEFIWCKRTWKNCEDDVERAYRWYYMIMMSFGAQGRAFGRSIKPPASISKKLYNNIQLLYPIHHRMRNVTIENQDWRCCLKDFDSKDTVFYLDPPYYEYAKGMYEHDMDKSEHVELLERIHSLEGFVALSGYDNDLYNKYSWNAKYQWEVDLTSVGLAFTETNHMAGKENYQSRRKVTETLWIKE